MRPKTDKEKEFNDIAATYQIKAFTAQEFDTDKELQKAFNSFLEFSDFTALADPSRKGEIPDMYYTKFFELYGKSKEKIDQYEAGIKFMNSISSTNPSIDGVLSHKDLKKFFELNNRIEEEINNNDDSNVVLCTQQLFELHTPIKDISCWEYFDAYMLEHMLVPPYGSQNKITLINDKIKQWHKTRRQVDKIKPFIEERFPRWSKASEKEKKEYVADIKKLISELEILGIDTSMLEKVYYFISNYTLNQLNKYKADLLLELKLPLINSKEIANKILKNSKL